MVIPIFIIIGIMGIFYRIGYYAGEFADIDEAIEDQRADHAILVGYGYKSDGVYYKLHNANYYQADIIALGTSRAMQFKGIYFKESFYNCGGAVSGNYNEYRNFLQNLSYTPETVILDLDSWVFNDEWNRSCTEYNELIQIQKSDDNVMHMLKLMIKDYLNKKWTWDSLSEYANNIGFNGKVRDHGFMYDGSRYYGSAYRYPEEQDDYMFVASKYLISRGNKGFQYGEHIDPDTLVQLDNLLSYCAENDIYVIAYVAPYAPSIYEEMENSGNYGYLSEIAPACEVELGKFGFEFYDYTDGSCLGVTDDFFIDGFHGSEVTYAYMVRDMIAHGSRIDDYIDNDKLNLLLDSAYSGMTFEDPDRRTVY